MRPRCSRLPSFSNCPVVYVCASCQICYRKHLLTGQQIYVSVCGWVCCTVTTLLLILTPASGIIMSTKQLQFTRTASNDYLDSQLICYWIMNLPITQWPLLRYRLLKKYILQSTSFRIWLQIYFDANWSSIDTKDTKTVSGFCSNVKTPWLDITFFSLCWGLSASGCYVYLHFLVAQAWLWEMGRPKDGSLLSYFHRCLWRNYFYFSSTVWKTYALTWTTNNRQLKFVGR